MANEAAERMRRVLWTAARPIMTPEDEIPADYDHALARGEIAPLWMVLAEAAVGALTRQPDLESDDSFTLAFPLEFERDEMARLADAFLGKRDNG